MVNADAWCPGSLADFAGGWDGERIRLLLAGDDELRPDSGLAGALMPWADVAALAAEPSGLYEVSWRAAQADGRLEVVRHDGPVRRLRHAGSSTWLPTCGPVAGPA